MKLKFEKICVYCKSYDMKKKQCKGKACGPAEKPDDKKCRWFRQSEDSKFCFAEEKGINDKLPTPWSDYKREQLQKMYQSILQGGEL